MGRRTTGARGAVLLVGTTTALGGGEALAQEREPIPTIPAGIPAVVFPVQSVRPTPGGAWPGGATSDREALERIDAELIFAFGEEPGAADWAMPDDVLRRLARNPTIKVDPYRLAYHGIIKKPDPRDQLYEPLHSQLRQVAALFNTRVVVVPLMLRYEIEAPDPEGDRAPPGENAIAADEGRAVLLIAIIDVRMSKVLWHGEIRGGLAEATASRLLTTLAFTAATQLSPS